MREHRVQVETVRITLIQKWITVEMAHGSASKGHLDIDCYGQHVCSGRCEVVGKSLNKRPDSSKGAHLFNKVQ